MDYSNSEKNFSEKYIISNISYFDNLLTPGNPYNFQIIPQNPKGSIIFSLINKQSIQYKLLTCENEKIKFKIEKSSKNITEYPSEYEINKKNESKIIKLDLKKDEIISHSFESEKEFLFTYMFYNSDTYCYEILHYYSILSIDEISKNLLKVNFSPVYLRCLSQYYIIISKKDKNNNIETFSNACYISKILSQNSQDIVIKPYRYENKNDYTLLITLVDITKLHIDENTELVATILDYNSFNLYKPLEFKLEKKDPIEFKIGEEVDFDFKDRIFFKFDYKKEKDLPQKIYFYFEFNFNLYIFLMDNRRTALIYLNKYFKDLIHITLTNSGTYFLELYGSIYQVGKFKFKSFIPEQLINTIDLTQKIYYENFSFKLNRKFEPSFYKVKDIKNNTNVYFIYNFQIINSEVLNPFIVCNFNSTECKNNITSFTFLKGNEYTIYINLIQKNESSDDIYYYYPLYIFFPIFDDTIEEIEEGFYSISSPKIYIVNLKNKDKLFLHYEDANIIYLSYSKDKNISKNKDTLHFDKISELESISEKENYNYGIIMIIPFMYKSTKFIIANLFLDNFNKKEFILPVGKNALFFVENNLDKTNTLTTRNNLRKIKEKENYELIYEDKVLNEDKKDNDYYGEDDEEDDNQDDDEEIGYNILTTFVSEEKQLRFILEDNINKKYDFIAKNTFPIPFYVDKCDKEINIKIKKFKKTK